MPARAAWPPDRPCEGARMARAWTGCTAPSPRVRQAAREGQQEVAWPAPTSAWRMDRSRTRRARGDRIHHGLAASGAGRRVPRVRVMVLGAGLVGTALARGLRARGHHVTQAGRDTRAGAGTIALDFNALPDDATLVRALSDLDVLVNTVGIFRQTAQQRFAAVHVDTPLRLFAAARSAGVRRVLQVSALGADPASPVPFLASKGRADAALLAHDHLERCVVRPSLVF